MTTHPGSGEKNAYDEAKAWEDNYHGMAARWASCDSERLAEKARADDAEMRLRIMQQDAELAHSTHPGSGDTERIAALLYDHAPFEMQCACGWEPEIGAGPGNEQHRAHLADVLARDGDTRLTALRERIEALCDKWDGYGHGRFNVHLEEYLPCGTCALLARLRALLADTGSAGADTDGSA